MRTIAENFLKLALLLINQPDSEYNILVAYKSSIFFINNDLFAAVDEEDLTPEDAELYQQIQQALPPINSYGDSPENFFQAIIDEHSDIIIGHYYNDRLEILNNIPKNPISSLYLKKLQKQLNISRIIINELPIGDDVEESYSSYAPQEMKGNLPSLLYHGTSLNNARQIARQGLSPKPHKSNFPNLVRHQDKVFLTSDFQKATFHAWKATDNELGGNQGFYSRNKSNFGIVFKFKIPDPSKLTSDFDAANIAHKNNLKPFSFSKELGWVGYKGTILPSFIEGIYFIKNDGDKRLISKDELFDIDEEGFLPSDYEFDDEDELE